jgi:hypothetical protein
MAIYKYCNVAGKFIILNLEIKATPPNELADECEVRPVVINSDPMAWAQRERDEMLADPSYFNSFNSNTGRFGKLTFPQFKDWATSTGSKLIEEMAKASPKTADHLRTEWLNIMSRRWGLVSLTTSTCVDVMWERYADGHRGLLVEFDEANGIFGNLSFVTCEYCDTPVVFDMAEKGDLEAIGQIARQKRTEFSFENESRLIVPLSECRKDPRSSPVLNLYRLDASAIVSVTFGLMTSNPIKQEVLMALTRPELRHVTKWQIERGQGGTVNDLKRSQLP